MTHDVSALGMRPIRDLLHRLAERDMRLHSLLVHRSGRTVLDLWQWPHVPELKHRTHSMTKSVTVTAVALAEAEGLLAFEDPVAGFFADRLSGPVGENLGRIRIRDLMTMRTGHRVGLSGATTRLRKTGWVDEFLEQPVDGLPGHNFTYSSISSHVLSAIVQRVSGLPVDEYLRPRLFEPLGITDYTWERDPEGVCSGGNGLSLRPADLLAFGVLYLQDGLWQGKRILPAGWTRAASALHVRYATGGTWNGKEVVPPPPGTVTDSGYGYQFWATDDGIYNASGIFGQECMVFPEQDAVVAVYGAMGEPSYHDLPGILRDAFRAALAGPGPDLAAEVEASAEVDRLVRLAKDEERLDPAVRREGFRATYEFAEGGDGLRSLVVEVRADAVLVTVEDELGSHPIEHGLGRWVRQDTGVSVGRLHHSYQDESAPILAGAEWAGPDELKLTWHFLEAPFIDRLTLRFGDDDITVGHTVNVNSGPTALPAAHGKRR